MSTRRSVAVAAAAALALTLSACGSDDEPEVDGPVDTAEETAPAGADGSGDDQQSQEGGDDGAESGGNDGTDDGTGDGGADGDDPGANGSEGGEAGDSGDGAPDGEEAPDDQGAGGQSSGDGGADDQGSSDPGAGGEGAGGDSGVEGDVEAARAGLARYLEANMPPTPQTSTNFPGCPAVDQTVMEAAVAQVGYPGSTLGGWSTEIEWDEFAEGDDVIGIVCGGDTDGNPNDSDYGVGAGVMVVDAPGGDLTNIVGSMEFTPGPDSVGGEIATFCEEDLCAGLWRHDGFVAGAVLMTDGATEQQASDLLVIVLPDILRTLP